MITHSVFFILKHAESSIEEAAFLKKAMQLRSISTVRNFQCARQTSLKNKYKLALIMQFEDQTGYDFYSEHPDHKNFVENVWLREVDEFLELDYEEWSAAE
jgi:hypothetical protein